MRALGLVLVVVSIVLVFVALHFVRGPGSTAPDESLTTPAIPLLAWARAVAGIDTNHVADSATANHTLRDSLRSLISVSSRASGSSATLPDPAARQARSVDHANPH